MAIIPCPECGKQISDKSYNCIHCGCPIASANDPDAKKTVSAVPAAENNSTEFKKIAQKALPFIKKNKIILSVVSVVLVVVIVVSAVLQSALNIGGSNFSASKIELNKTYKAGNVAEFVIKRVGSNKVLSTEKQDDETFVDFFCKFTNISDTEYDDEDVITAYATGVKSKARYTNSYIRNTDNGMVITHDIRFTLLLLCRLMRMK